MKKLARFGALSSVSVLVSCGSPPAATTANGSPSGSASAGSSPTQTADPGPRLTRRTGKATARKLPDVRMVATKQLSEKGHFYVCGVLPPAQEALTSTVFIAVSGERHGFAAEGPLANGSELCVRLVGEGAPKGSLLVTRNTQAEKNRGGFVGGRIQNVYVDNIDKAAKDVATKKAFYVATSSTFASRPTWNSPQSFYSFASGRLSRMADPKLATQPQVGGIGLNPAFPQPQPELDQLMDLYTGMTSVEEALQNHRGLFATGSKQAASIDPKSIQGVPMPEHPWAKMQERLGTKPVVEPLAASVPHDMLYAGFHDIGKALVLLRELDQRISPLAQALEHDAGFRNFGERTDEELALQRTGLAEKFGTTAVDGIALTASDPFFREGTDVSIVFGVKSRALLGGALAAMAEMSKTKHPTQTEKTYTLGAKKVTWISTPDGRVSRHQVDLGSVIVISTSKRALERFVEVSDKKRKSLAESPDFRYFRSRTPADPKAEDGFVFASDELVKAAVSPRTKILEARRLAHAADVGAVNHAALLYGWLEGKAAANAGELVKAGYLEQKELAHADGGRIDFDAKRGASSSWGRPARMTSLLDLDLGMVTPAEKQAYERFRDTYQQYWRGYVDPIGARVSVSQDGKKISADVRILPLIQQSEYQSMFMDVGEQHVKIPELSSGLRWVLAIGKDAPIRQMGDRMVGQFSRRKELALSWIGDWVAAGAADRSGLWDLALRSGDVPEVGEPRKDDEISTLSRAPVWVAIHVKSRIALAAALTALRTMVQETAPGTTDWRPGGAYRGIEITEIHAKEDSRSREEIRLSYAIVKDVLVVSLDRVTLERQLDNVLDGNVPDSKSGEMQSAIELRPANGGFLSKALMGLVEAEALNAHDASLLAYEAMVRGIPEVRKNRDELRERSLAFLGVEPVSPFGGEMSLGGGGLASHSTRGTAVEPIVPATSEEKASVLDVVKNVDWFSVGMGFEGKGDERGLRTRVDWRRR